MNINDKTFSIVRRTGTALRMAISGFSVAVTFLFDNVFGLAIEYVVTMIMGTSATVSAKKVSILFSAMKLMEDISHTFSAKKISLSVRIRENLKGLLTISQGISALPIFSMRQKVSVLISSRLPITVTPLLAQFNSLIVFDPQTLGDLDGETLGDMDYTVV